MSGTRRLRHGVLDNDIAVQPTARRPLTFHSRGFRLYNCDEVVHDAIGHRFVKDPFIAESLQVHFQALQFHADLVGNVGENDFSVIGLTGLRAHRREFGAVMDDREVAIRTGIFKDFQNVAKVI